MPKYKTKPQEIEAIQWIPSNKLKAGSAVLWLLENNQHFEVMSDGDLLIDWAGSPLRVPPTYWIVIENNIIAAYEPSLFETKYAEVNE